MEKTKKTNNLFLKYPNKYGFTAKNIDTIRVLDWERLKQYTWFNTVIKKPCWCHLEGCNTTAGSRYCDDDEFWIGFYEDGKVDHAFSAHGGMCGYEFDEFYDEKDIENKSDAGVQINAIRYLNNLVELKIISKPKKGNEKNKD